MQCHDLLILISLTQKGSDPQQRCAICLNCSVCTWMSGISFHEINHYLYPLPESCITVNCINQATVLRCLSYFTGHLKAWYYFSLFVLLGILFWFEDSCRCLAFWHLFSSSSAFESVSCLFHTEISVPFGCLQNGLSSGAVYSVAISINRLWNL